MSVSPRDATKLCYFRCLLEFCKVSQFVSQLVPRLACYDGRGIVRPETMAGGTFLSLQTLHHDTSLRDIDYCYILSVTLMAFLRNQLPPDRWICDSIELSHLPCLDIYLSWIGCWRTIQLKQIALFSLCLWMSPFSKFSPVNAIMQSGNPWCSKRVKERSREPLGSCSLGRVKTRFHETHHVSLCLWRWVGTRDN